MCHSLTIQLPTVDSIWDISRFFAIKNNATHIYTMEYCSAIKRNEIELFVVRWIDLESVIQSEVNQKEKNKYRMLTHIYGI